MSLTIVTWNVNSLRSAISKGFVSWLEMAKPDIVCLQETRATLDKLRPLETLFKGYQATWHPAVRPGYAGTAILSRFKPLFIEYGLHTNEDPEGRSITADFGSFRVVCAYAPNSPPDTPKIEIKHWWLDRLRAHVSSIGDKPAFIAGDLNVAHTSLDSGGIPHPKHMNGCTREERRGFQSLLDECGLIDPQRFSTKEALLSTWWHPREAERRGDNGIRYDYILLPSEYHHLVLHSAIHADIWGSDHCPVSVCLDLPTNQLTPARALIGQGSLL